MAKRQIYRIGGDIYNASNNQKLGYTDFMANWNGKSDVQDLGQRSQTPTPTNTSSANAYSTPGAYNSAMGNTPPAPTPITPISPVTQNNNSVYTIKSGDTLSAIAKSQGTTIAEIMKLNPNLTNPNLIYSGKSLNLPGSNNGSQDYSSVNTFQDAQSAINGDQQKTIDNSNSDGEPATRKTVDDIIADVTKKVTPTTAMPTAPNYSGALQDWRSEYGVNDLETQLDELRAQEQDIMAQKESRVAAERGKTVAMNVIEGRISETERQENERLSVVQRSIANATNQLNTKYNIINTLMKTKEMDYNSSVELYDKQMSNNIAIFNTARDIDESNKTEEERQQDNARSNAQIMINAYTSAGTIYANLSDTEKTNLTKMGVQAGLGADFFSNVLKTSAGKDILTTIVSADDTKATILYKDGTTKVISTGLPPKPISSSGGLTKSEQKAEEMELNRQSFMADVGEMTGEDGKVDPEKMILLRQDVALNNPELLTWFDNAYQPKNMLNSKWYPQAVRKNEWITK